MVEVTYACKKLCERDFDGDNEQLIFKCKNKLYNFHFNFEFLRLQIFTEELS